MIRTLRWLALAALLSASALACAGPTAAVRTVLVNHGGPQLAPPLVAAAWQVSGTDGTHIATFANSTLRYQSDTTTPQLMVQALVLTAGATYDVTVLTTGYTSGSIKTDSFTSAVVIASGLGTVTFRGVAVSNAFQITRNTTSVDLTVASVSVRRH